MREIDAIVIQIQSDEQALHPFVTEHHRFIKSKASHEMHRVVTTSDEVWSVALQAFVEAIQHYSYDKGSFFHFAELVIHRKCIDYKRSLAKYHHEVTVHPASFAGDSDEEEFSPLQLEIARKSATTTNDDLRLEIETANAIFEQYGFRFWDLVASSPKADKTKSSCAQVVAHLLQNPILLQSCRDTKLLPIKILEKNTKVPRKIIERHRKYIIATSEILSGEFPYLSTFLQYIREEMRP